MRAVDNATTTIMRRRLLVVLLIIKVALRCHAYCPAPLPSRSTRAPSPLTQTVCGSPYRPRPYLGAMSKGAPSPQRPRSLPPPKMGSWNDNNDNDGSGNEQAVPLPLVGASLAAQPVVWTSLYFVATTGAGLPPGPFGLLGALEGFSYLIVVGIVGASLCKKAATGSGLPAGENGLLGAAEGLSYLSLLGGLLALASLVGERGCVPNAKPLLDYSEYLPVCDPDSTGTPGLFGQ